MGMFYEYHECVLLQMGVDRLPSGSRLDDDIDDIQREADSDDNHH